MRPISIQLYTLRNEVKKDLRNVLKQVADIGYKAVEPAGFYDMTPKEYKKMLGSYGLEILSSHTPWASLSNMDEVIGTAEALGLDIAAAGFGPDDFKDVEAVKRTADTVNAMTDRLKKSGIKLFLHNHAPEFELLEGKIKHHYIAEMCPDVCFEIDTYWASNYGAVDVEAEMKYFGDRAILLHVKDGTFVRGEPNLPVGSGKMDFKSVLNAASGKSVRALVVEFDSCATDIFDAVRKSYDYLARNKFGAGNK